MLRDTRFSFLFQASNLPLRQMQLSLTQLANHDPNGGSLEIEFKCCVSSPIGLVGPRRVRNIPNNQGDNSFAYPV